MEKVKLSREVAETLEALRKRGYTEYQIVFNLCAGGHPHDDFDKLENRDIDKIIRALYIGYEVEQAPEEAAIQWCIRTESIARGKSAHDVVMVIKHILKGEKTNA